MQTLKRHKGIKAPTLFHGKIDGHLLQKWKHIYMQQIKEVNVLQVNSNVNLKKKKGCCCPLTWKVCWNHTVVFHGPDASHLTRPVLETGHLGGESVRNSDLKGASSWAQIRVGRAAGRDESRGEPWGSLTIMTEFLQPHFSSPRVDKLLLDKVGSTHTVHAVDRYP